MNKFLFVKVEINYSYFWLDKIRKMKKQIKIS